MIFSIFLPSHTKLGPTKEKLGKYFFTRHFFANLPDVRGCGIQFTSHPLKNELLLYAEHILLHWWKKGKNPIV